MNIIKNNKFKDLVEILKSIPCQDVGLYQRKCTYKLFNSKSTLHTTDQSLALN